jgi:multisubunit Na+/H+ antiporter MnhE subunit
VSAPLAGAGDPERRGQDLPFARRVGSWVVWWVLLMAFWVWIDDSLALAELIAGAIVAAAGATVAEVVQYQAGSHIRVRAEWLAKVLQLPLQIAQDTVILLAALWRKVVSGIDPPSGFEVLPVAPGDDSAEAKTRRALILGAKSVSPNTYALGLDRERKLMIVHHLVMAGAGSGSGSPPRRGRQGWRGRQGRRERRRGRERRDRQATQP